MTSDSGELSDIEQDALAEIANLGVIKINHLKKLVIKNYKI